MLSIDELKTIFNTDLKKIYTTYELIFDNIKLNEEEIKYMLKLGFLKYEFIDDKITKKFIKSCRINISYDLYIKIKAELIKKKINKSTIKYFNYKYHNYAIKNTFIKKTSGIFADLESFINKILGLIIFILIVSGIFFLIMFGLMDKLNEFFQIDFTNMLYLIAGIFILKFLIMILIFFLKFWISSKLD